METPIWHKLVYKIDLVQTMVILSITAKAVP